MLESLLSIACEPFDRLEQLIKTASRAPFLRPADQVRYLISYLQHPDAGAKTIIVERPYVDRHWLEEYSQYYAKMLKPPPPKATRLHFLSTTWSIEDFTKLIRRAVSGERTAVEREVSDSYLGFTVIRPLPSAPLGRTILRPYAGESNRCFAASQVNNHVHLAGLTIPVVGLPFQQQDQGVGACATTALWSALTKVMRNDGTRPVTPFAITSAATNHRVQARAFPAIEGLDLDQMATAIYVHGYQPHLFRPTTDEPDDFVLALKSYLRSGIPVVVRVRVDGEMHALTFVGFREADSLDDKTDIKITIRQQPRLRSRGVIRWYVHDDRLGAYARLGFLKTEDERIDHTRIKLLPTEPGFELFESEMVFSDALVPLYPKLRLTAEELIEFAVDMLPPISLLSGSENLYVEPSFHLGGDYLHSLHDRPIDHERLVMISTKLLLSRYVASLSWFHNDHWLCDVVYDTTDLRRDERSHPPVLGIFPSQSQWLESFENMRDVRFGPDPLIV